MSNITGIDAPQNGDGRDGSYVTKLSDSLNALDDHTHANGSGLPVRRIHVDATDNTTVTASAGVASIKDASITTAYAVTGTSLPVGSIISFFDKNNGAPTGGWLRCDGSAVSRTTYATLFAVIGTKFGSGDGSTTFNLPALAGQFLRGADLGAARDPDRSSRTASGSGGATGDNVGTLQKGATKTHTHTISPDPSSAWGDAGNSGNTGSYGGSEYWGMTTINYYINNSGGNEFRPKNMAVAWWIKT